MDRRIMRIESPSGELLRMKEVIPDEPMSPDEEQGMVQTMDEWMVDLRFYILFNSMSVISG